jgi:hypothetical protein
MHDLAVHRVQLGRTSVRSGVLRLSVGHPPTLVREQPIVRELSAFLDGLRLIGAFSVPVSSGGRHSQAGQKTE